MKSLQTIIFIFFLACSTIVSAQPPSFDDDVDDETPAAPIPGIAIMLLTAAGIGIIATKKEKNR